MATSFMVPINRFFRRIEEDREFFDYYQLSGDEAMNLATTRARNYLRDAIDRVMLDGKPDIDFTDVDDAAYEFHEDLTSKEIYLLASLMYEYYMGKDIARIKTFSTNYTAKELNVFSPSEARTSFNSLYRDVCAKNEVLLDTYRNTDRLTGAYKGISYADYDEEDS